MIDILGGKDRVQEKVLDKGFVALVDCMPRLVEEGHTADQAIVQAARVSYSSGTKSYRKDRALIRYLVRNEHLSPLEMVSYKFHIKAPLFVSRQLVRHRTFKINELSGRYSKLKGEFYIPSKIRAQSQSNKQGSEGTVLAAAQEEFLKNLRKTEEDYRNYEQSVANGVSRELARIALPLNIYTEWFWKADLRNLLHMLKLRMDPHAQWETQQYANAIYKLIAPTAPMTIEAFKDYIRDSVSLSPKALKAIVTSDFSKLSKEEKETLFTLIEKVRKELYIETKNT